MLNACGNELKYARTGTVYHAAGPDPVAAMNGEKSAPAADAAQPAAAEPAAAESAPATVN